MSKSESIELYQFYSLVKRTRIPKTSKHAARDPLNGICCMGRCAQVAVVIIPRTNTGNCYRPIQRNFARFAAATIQLLARSPRRAWMMYVLLLLLRSVIFFRSSCQMEPARTGFAVLLLQHTLQPFRQLQMHRCQARLVFICCSRLTQNDSEWENKNKTTESAKSAEWAHFQCSFSTGSARFYRASKQIILAFPTPWNVAWKCS